jgi:hypothetical protein
MINITVLMPAVLNSVFGFALNCPRAARHAPFEAIGSKNTLFDGCLSRV